MVLDHDLFVALFTLLYVWKHDDAEKMEALESCRECVRTILGVTGVHRATEVLAELWIVLTEVLVYQQDPLATVPVSTIPISSAAPSPTCELFSALGHLRHADIFEEELSSTLHWVGDMMDINDGNNLEVQRWLWDVGFILETAKFYLIHRRGWTQPATYVNQRSGEKRKQLLMMKQTGFLNLKTKPCWARIPKKIHEVLSTRGIYAMCCKMKSSLLFALQWCLCFQSGSFIHSLYICLWKYATLRDYLERVPWEFTVRDPYLEWTIQRYINHIITQPFGFTVSWVWKQKCWHTRDKHHRNLQESSTQDDIQTQHSEPHENKLIKTQNLMTFFLRD